MRLLAIDTTFEACSVGLSADESRPPIAISEVIGRGHAERLIGMIQSVLAEAGLPVAALDRIAVTIGPGSFTGVRVGVAAVRGLSLVTGCQAVGIGTLPVIAERGRALIGARPVLAVLDARRGEVYAQSFEREGVPFGPPEVASVALIAERVDERTLLAGAGADQVLAELGSFDEARVVHREAAPEITALLRLGRQAPPPSAPLHPLYLRPPDAKPQAAFAVARQEETRRAGRTTGTRE
jgi:tRNA threonylcarbamoyl adenosine modification protein YeaZ